MKRNKSHRLLWRNASDGPGVYCLRNVDTGRLYIGMTERPIPERIAEHCRSSKGSVQELFLGSAKVEVVCDVMFDSTPLKMLEKEREVGERILTKYPGLLVNHKHLLGKTPNKSCTNQKQAVSSAKQKKSNMTNQRRVIAVKPNGTWEAFTGVRECARAMGLDNSTVSKCLNGLRPHHEGNFFMDVPANAGAVINGIYSAPTK